MRTLLDFFWARVKKLPNDGCWEWTGSRDSHGYGVIETQGIRVQAHRFSFTQFVGEIPPEHFACHRCDNPPCVRPDHLFAGTAMDNARDMQAKGRALDGEKNPKARFTVADIREMRKRFADGTPASELAEDFDVGIEHVYRIVHRKSWKSVA